MEKQKKNTEEKPNNTLNKTLKDIEQNIKRIQENKKQLLNSKTSSITKIKIEEIANKEEEKERKKRQEEINSLRMLNPYLNPSLPEGDILRFSNPNPTRKKVIQSDRTGKYVLNPLNHLLTQ
jgi:hypothetical protein